MKRCAFSAVLKVLIVALALILFGRVFQAFAADTVNDRAPHEFLDLVAQLVCRAQISTEWFVRFNEATHVSRRDNVDCLEYKHGDFEDDYLFDC